MKLFQEEKRRILLELDLNHGRLGGFLKFEVRLNNNRIEKQI